MEKSCTCYVRISGAQSKVVAVLPLTVLYLTTFAFLELQLEHSICASPAMATASAAHALTPPEGIYLPQHTVHYRLPPGWTVSGV